MCPPPPIIYLPLLLLSYMFLGIAIQELNLRKLFLFTDTKTDSSDSTFSPGNYNGVIIGSVVAAVVVIVTAILIVACFLYRQILKRESTQDTGYIQNPAYKGDTQSDRTLPQIPHTDIKYEEPAIYTQLDTSNRTPIDENYQSLNEEDYEPLQTYQNENIPQYASLNTFDNAEDEGNPDESAYEELP